MATTKPENTTTKTAGQKVAAVVPKTPAKAAKGRKVHMLVKTGADGKITELENFSGELEARRALDGRPSWQYLGLVPGAPYVVNELGGVSTDG